MSTLQDQRASNGLLGYSIINQGWEMSMVSGEPIRFTNPRYGTLEIGMTAGGKYDTWRWHQNGGGGVLVVPWTRRDGEIYVMAWENPRENLIGDEPDIEMTGGFLNGTEPVFTGAMREAFEETGVMPNSDDLEHCSGRLYTDNRAFGGLKGEHEGNHAFQFELSDAQIELIEADSQLHLIDWRQFARDCRDALSGMAVLKMLADVL